MRRILIESPLIPNTHFPIPESEARHLHQVLRLSTGDSIWVCDALGGLAKATLAKSHGKEWLASVQNLEAEIPKPEQVHPLELWMSILKGDAMEWTIEKSVELGCDRFVPLQSQNCVVVTKKDPESFQSRWNKIARQALKQCERRFGMDIPLPSTFEDQFARALKENIHVIWADENSGRSSEAAHFAKMRIKSNQRIAILIGPEGGFSDYERQRLLELTQLHPNTITKVSLGSLILRAETAAIYSISQCVTLMQQAKD